MKMPVLSWFDKSTIKHLRLPFSFFLLPVYLFALSQSESSNGFSAFAGFMILHFLLFPSTNGYNSYQDRDTTSIGGLKHPPTVTHNLFYVTLIMDIIAVIAGLMVSVYFSIMLLVFIGMSHLYSYRGIRLKKYPIIAFLTVFIFQGGFVYLMSLESIHPGHFSEHLTRNHFICMAISSLFIGSMYPLTQIYQHKADKDDGVISLSYLLGYKGTFLFSGILFGIATILLAYYLFTGIYFLYFLLFILFTIPVVIRLSKWFSLVKKDTRNANYENTMAINILSSVCMNLFFMVMVIGNKFLFSR